MSRVVASPAVVGIDHVQLAMPPGGEPRAKTFYEGLLGIPEVDKPASLAGRGGCWFEHGDLRVHLGVEAPFVPARKAHPAFRVADLDGLVARLEAAGHPARTDVPLPGVRRVHVDDPFGNRVEFVQPTL